MCSKSLTRFWSNPHCAITGWLCFSPVDINVSACELEHSIDIWSYRFMCVRTCNCEHKLKFQEKKKKELKFQFSENVSSILLWKQKCTAILVLIFYPLLNWISRHIMKYSVCTVHLNFQFRLNNNCAIFIGVKHDDSLRRLYFMQFAGHFSSRCGHIDDFTNPH